MRNQFQNTNKPLYKISLLLSYVFHPLLMPTYAITILLFSLPQLHLVNPEGRFWFLGVNLFYTFLLPGAGAYLLKRMGLMGSLQSASKTERILPLLFTMIIYGGYSFFFLTKLQVGTILVVVLGSISLCVALNFIINIFYKISSHGIGVGGFSGAMLGLIIIFPDFNMIWLFIMALLVSGMVLSARLYLQAHSLTQVLLGWSLGFGTLSVGLILFT